MLRTLAALVAAALVSGCSGGAPATAPARSPGTTPGGTTGSASPSVAPTSSAPVVPAAPRNAACYRLTGRQLTRPTNTSKPVPCAGVHTARTIYVGTVDTVVDGHSVRVDSATVQKQVATACPRRLAAYVGGSRTSRDLSRLHVVWFSPTLAQSDRGARWFRCDLVVFAKGAALLELPRRDPLRRVLDRPRALDTYGLCGTAAPGAPGFERVACRLGHSWRAIDTIPLSGGNRYPGARAVSRAGDAGCKAAARSRAADTLKFTYGWEWPKAAQWAAGQRFGYCWVPTRD